MPRSGWCGSGRIGWPRATGPAGWCRTGPWCSATRCRWTAKAESPTRRRTSDACGVKPGDRDPACLTPTIHEPAAANAIGSPSAGCRFTYRRAKCPVPSLPLVEVELLLVGAVAQKLGVAPPVDHGLEQGVRVLGRQVEREDLAEGVRVRAPVLAALQGVHHGAKQR